MRTPSSKPAPKKKTPAPSRFVFDEAAADRACQFFEVFLKHTKGSFAGQPFKPEKWQANEIIRPLFGWKVRSTGLRRYTEAYIEIPRKNGKSTLAAGIELYLTFADGEAVPEVYCGATDREQAEIVFKEAVRMVRKSPELSEMCEIFTDSILIPETLGSLKVLSGDATNKDGLNISGAVIDELHAHKTRELYDVLKTATGSREQPLLVSLTTAGRERRGICWEMHEHALRVRAGDIHDETFLPVVYCAEESDDWTSEKTWKKANPGYGTSLRPDYMHAQVVRAKTTPGYEPTFRRYHLNVWGMSEKRFLDMSRWDACALPVDRDSLKGRECFVGLDLSKRTDLTAAVALFPRPDEGFDILTQCWVPKDNIDGRAVRDRVPYPTWVQQGYITTTPGNVTDYDVIENLLAAWSQEFQIKQLAIDPWGSHQLGTRLANLHGIEVVEVPQTLKHMSEPTKRLDQLVLQRKISHNGHPVLRWCASNLVVFVDPNENLRPTKKKSVERIDCVVALINALSRAILADEGRSVYESEGLKTL